MKKLKTAAFLTIFLFAFLGFLPEPVSASSDYGSISVCVMYANSMGAIQTGSTNLPYGEFSFALRKNNINNPPYETLNFSSTDFAPNKSIISGGVKDAQCTKFSNLPIEDFYYKQETVSKDPGGKWMDFLYNDQNKTTVHNLSDLYTYMQNPDDSDGIIVLHDDVPNRTIVILNKYHENYATAYCPFRPQSGRTVVNFSGKDIRSDMDQIYAKDNVPASLSAGTYKVSLFSYDAYKRRQDVNQPNEKWYVALRDSSGRVVVTNSSSDLPDGIPIASSNEVVNSSLSVPKDITDMTAFHSAFPDKTSPNDFIPVCAAFDAVQVVKPNTPPTIALNGSATINLTVGQTYTELGATAHDLEDGDLTSAIVETGSVNTQAAGTYTLTYSVTDSGGLSSQTQRVVNVAPKPKIIPTIDIKANGSDGPVQIILGAPLTLSWNSTNAVSCNSNWGSVVQTSGTQSLVTSNLFPAQAYLITCTSSTGDTASDSVLVKTIPNVVPAVDLKANGSDGPVEVFENSDVNLTWTTANASLCSSAINPTSFSNLWSGAKDTSGVQSVHLADSGSYVFTLSCSSSTGATNSDSVVVNVKKQVIKPTLTVSLSANPSAGVVPFSSVLTATVGGTATGDTSYRFRCKAGDDWSVPQASNIFSCTYSSAANYVASVEASRNGLVEVSFTSVVANNPAVHVNTPPTIALNGPATINLTVGQTYTELGATAHDAEDGDLTSQIVITGAVNTAEAGTYLVTYTVTDSGGLSASVSRTIIVCPLQPVLTLSVDLLADPSSGAVPLTSILKAQVSGTITGNVLYKFRCQEADDWSAKQASNKFTCNYPSVGTFTASVFVERGGLVAQDNAVIEVTNPSVKNNTPPVISLNGSSTINLTVGQTYTELGATAHDLEDGDLTSAIVETGSVNTQAAGTYALTYSVTDSGGLSAEVMRTVIVSSGGGNQEPIPTLSVNLFANPPIGVVPFSSVLTATVGGTAVGDITYEFKCQDSDDWSPLQSDNTFTCTYASAGNFITKVKAFRQYLWATDSAVVQAKNPEIIIVPPVNTPPVISLNGPSVINLIVGQTYIELGATAHDLEDGDLTSRIVITGPVNVGVLGVYVVNYSVTDSGGLTASVLRTINVINPGGGGGNGGGGGGGAATLTVSLFANPQSGIVPFNSILTASVGGTATGDVAYIFKCQDSDNWSPLQAANTFSCAYSSAGNYTASVEAARGGLVAQDQAPIVANNPTPVVVPPGGGGGGNGGGGGGNRGGEKIMLVITNEKVNQYVPGTALVTWDTNLPATSRVVFGDVSVPTRGSFPNYGYQFSTSEIAAKILKHAMVVDGLLPNHTYYFRAISTDAPDSPMYDISTELTLTTGLGIGAPMPTPILPQAQTPPSGTGQYCNYLYDYLHIGWSNNPVEVRKLQVFLKSFEGFSNLKVTGIFDQPTFDAVSLFQKKYPKDILNPWGYSDDHSTGFVYILTKKKVNEIYCKTSFPLTPAQQEEIREYRDYYLKNYGGNSSSISTGTGAGGATVATSTAKSLEKNQPTTTGGKAGEISGGTSSPRIVSGGALRNLASAIFSAPLSWNSFLECLILTVVVLLITYILAIIFESEKTKNAPESEKRSARAMKMLVGMIVAIVLAGLFGIYLVILPLIIISGILIAVMVFSKPETDPDLPKAPEEKKEEEKKK